LNRYAYCSNNPITYVDPTGYVSFNPGDWLNAHNPGNYLNEINDQYIGGPLNQVASGDLTPVMNAFQFMDDAFQFLDDAGTALIIADPIPNGAYPPYTFAENAAGAFIKGIGKGGKSAIKAVTKGAGKVTAKMTAKEAAAAAKKLGFQKTDYLSHGQPVFKKGNRYITPDVDSHSGGVWKMADSVERLRSKTTRMGTYDEYLNRIGD
jgi:hypothetical protein